LDADERVTPALREEVLQVVENQPKEVAFWIGRENYFMEKRVRYSGWRKVGRLQAKLIHNTYKDMAHFLEKMRRYARLSAQDYSEKTPRVTLYHLWLKPAFRFFKHYILKLGFLDGKVGFIISVIMAWGVFLRYLNIIENSKK